MATMVGRCLILATINGQPSGSGHRSPVVKVNGHRSGSGGRLRVVATGHGRGHMWVSASTDTAMGYPLPKINDAGSGGGYFDEQRSDLACSNRAKHRAGWWLMAKYVERLLSGYLPSGLR